MNKAKKAIAERLKSVDMVIEMLDARLPASSENPLLAQLAKGKPKLKILNKQDLADPERTAIWLDYFTAQEQTQAIALDSSEKAAAPKISRRLPQPNAQPQRHRQTPARADLRHPQCRQIHAD